MSTRRYDIDTLLDEVVTLPSMPESLARITKLLDNPNCSMHEVAQAVAMDPGLAAKTLRLVNSAYYGLGQEVKTVDHAVVLLGIRVIKNLTLTATVFNAINKGADLFVRHCVCCGVAMKVLARSEPLSRHVSSPDEAFVFGLLHDIGKVILEEYLPEESLRVIARVRNQQAPWHIAEKEVIGVDHAELGATLALKWKLSPSIAGAIAGHHDLSRCAEEYRPLAAILSAADYLCGAAGFPAFEPAAYQFDRALWEAAGFDNAALVNTLDAFFDSMPHIEELIQIAV